MKKIKLLIGLLSFLPFTVSAQTESKSVLDSDISGKYRQAVRNGFYHTLNNNSDLESEYHGFVDFGYTISVGDYKFGKFEINTSHGYQFNPYFFIGAGAGFHFVSEYTTPNMDIALDYRKRQIDIPIFTNVRWTIINNKITPYIDGKLGYYVTHNGGLYANLSVGCRFNTYGSQAVNFSVGYTHEELEFQTFDHFLSSNNMSYNRSARKLGTEGISIKLEYEF